MENIKTLETAALEERKSVIAAEATEDRSSEELAKIEEELRAINDELETRKAEEAERRAKAEEIVKGAGEIIMD